MPAAWVGAGAAVLGVANSMGAFGSPSGSQAGSTGAATQGQTDPYGAMGGRSSAGTSLMNLVNNPSMALSQPGYQQTLQQGTAASQAAAAASGTLQSGGQSAALQNLGQSNFNQYYTQMFNQLGSLSGATSQTPSGAANVQSNAAIGSAGLSNQIQQQQSQNLISGAGTVAGLFSGTGNMQQQATLGGYGSNAVSNFMNNPSTDPSSPSFVGPQQY